jgi:hypothetical protein
VPRGPFYSPKASRSRWRPTRKAKVVFCRVAHRTVGAPPDSQCSCLVRGLLPILAQMFVADSRQLAHRTVRCPLSTVGAGHASPADCAADRCAGGRWLTGQSGAPPDSPVNYSRTPPNFPESSLFTGVQSSAPDSPVCQTELDFGCTQPSHLQSFSSFLFSVFNT